MKRQIAFVVICLLPSAAFAQGTGYLEGSIGVAVIPDIHGRASGADIGIGTFTGTTSLKFGPELMFGVEAGLARLANTESLRMGLSWDHTNATLNSASVSGTVDPGSLPVSGSVDASDIDFESSINVIAVNAYLDLGDMMSLRPYVGAGAGPYCRCRLPP